MRQFKKKLPPRKLKTYDKRGIIDFKLLVQFLFVMMPSFLETTRQNSYFLN